MPELIIQNEAIGLVNLLDNILLLLLDQGYKRCLSRLSVWTGDFCSDQDQFRRVIDICDFDVGCVFELKQSLDSPVYSGLLGRFKHVKAVLHGEDIFVGVGQLATQHPKIAVTIDCERHRVEKEDFLEARVCVLVGQKVEHLLVAFLSATTIENVL